MEYSHFDCIGFSASTDRGMMKMVKKTTKNLKPFPENDYQGFSYALYENETGIQIYYTLKENSIYTANPHFTGQAKVSLKLLGMHINEAGDSLIEAEITNASEPVPVLFSMPDYYLHIDKELPRTADIQLTAFAESVEIFDTEEAFSDALTIEAEDGESFSFAKDYFTPVGLFDEENPEPRAQFAGIVQSREEHKNPLTGKKFVLLRVKSMFETDVVLPLQAAKNIRIGQIIHGLFWLSGLELS